MIDTNELRRLAQAATPGPWKLLPVGDRAKRFAVADINFLSVLTVAYECGTNFGAVYLDGDAKFIAAANPAAINELLDRLEEAESECLEQARLNGMGASREAALMAKLEAAEKEVEIERMRLAACGVAALGYFEGCAEEYISASLNDVLALRAKIEAMERQEPVAWCATDETGTVIESLGMNQSRRFDTALYLAPGAKGETK